MLLNFGVPQVFCSFQDHSNSLIQAICDRKECDRQSALCSKCMFQFHKLCDHHFTFLEDLPNKLVIIEKNNKMITQIIETLIIQLREIQQFYQKSLQYIQEYQTVKNTTNLNNIGSMLRKHQQIDVNCIQAECDQIFRIIENYFKPIHKPKFLTQYELNEAEEWRRKSREHNQNQQFGEAIKCIDEALKIDPESDVYLNVKGFALCNLQQFDQAIQCYDAALRINPKNDSALFNKGLALTNSSKPYQAIQCFDAALKIDQNDYQSWSNKGIALNLLKEYQQAIQCFDTALKLKINDMQALNNKGLALSNLHLYQEAIDCYDKVLQINPDHDMALNNKGFALFQLDEVQEAIQCYDASLTNNPSNELAWNNKRLALNTLKQTSEIIKCQDQSGKLKISSSRYNSDCILSIKLALPLKNLIQRNKILDLELSQRKSLDSDQKYKNTKDRLQSRQDQLKKQ